MRFKVHVLEYQTNKQDNMLMIIIILRIILARPHEDTEYSVKIYVILILFFSCVPCWTIFCLLQVNGG